MANRIPPEILRTIFEMVDDSLTLAVLTRCCFFFRSEAERVLYREMRLVDGTIQYKFLSTVVKRPQLAKLVRVYHSHKVVHKQRRSFANMLKRALECMDNLKELVVSRSPVPHGTLFTSECTFQLEKFIWDSAAWGLEQEEIFTFLKRQHNLKYLEWLSPIRWDLPPSSCPNLTTLRGNGNTLAMFLPGRHVVTLGWLADLRDQKQYVGDGFFDSVAEELRNIRYFSMGEYSRTKNFKTPWKHLHSVEVVQLDGVYNELPLMYKLPKLKTLIISINRRFRDHPDPLEDREDAVAMLFANCPSLRRVDITNGKGYPQANMYQRWIDGKLQPGLLTRAVVLSDEH